MLTHAMNLKIAQQIEVAGFSAWPCFEEELFEGWRLRFANGFTKRANSANASPQALTLTATDITEVERRYGGRGIETVFRLSSLPPLTELDTLLAARGYRSADRSSVMHMAIDNAEGRAKDKLDKNKAFIEESLSPEQWLDVYYAISGKSTKHLGAHLQLLQAMPNHRLFFVLTQGGMAVCCGIGVVTDAYLGLFEIATRSTHQGQGLATRLCQNLLHWGQSKGAHSAFLQVEAINTRAISIYERLGFQNLYQYWYRIPGA
jgi:N-acetylglutamate synthase